VIRPGKKRTAIVEIRQLKQAIDADDIDRVKTLMTQHPSLHRAPLGYGKSGPLTLAAECRDTSPTSARLSIARWMIEHGSDVHQGGDGPLMRAALGDRIPMMELLVTLGADVNAKWKGEYPIIFAPCETVNPKSLKWLLEHGADPNGDPGGRFAGTALDFVIGSYERSPALTACMDVLVAVGGTTKYDVPVVLALLRGYLDRVRKHLDDDPSLIDRRFLSLDFGTTGGRMLTLRGASLLHVASEYRDLEAVTLLLDRGANVNGRATIDDAGVGGQTAIFHSATQRDDAGLPIVQLLIDRGADLSVRAKVPGHYERPGEVIECTPLGYAVRFVDEPCRGDKVKTVELLRQRGALE
jgi:ankyrin repeat protein